MYDSMLTLIYKVSIEIWLSTYDCHYLYQTLENFGGIKLWLLILTNQKIACITETDNWQIKIGKWLSIHQIHQFFSTSKFSTWLHNLCVLADTRACAKNNHSDVCLHT